MSLEGGRPLANSPVELLPHSTQRLLTDSAGRFRFDGVLVGRYTLRVRSIGFNELREEIRVSRGGSEYEVELADWKAQSWCENERLLSSAPALIVALPDSLSFEVTLPSGARLRHTVVATGEGSYVRFQSRIANVGTVAASVMKSCSARATAQVFIELLHPGAPCSTDYEPIVPGDSMMVLSTGPLRGAPGRYRFHVHPVVPAALDAFIELDFVAEKRTP